MVDPSGLLGRSMLLIQGEPPARPGRPPCPRWEELALLVLVRTPRVTAPLRVRPAAGLVGASQDGLNLDVPSCPHTAAVPRQTHEEHEFRKGQDLRFCDP